MGKINCKNLVVERRIETNEESIWWDRLTLAQKFSVNTLSRYGYRLAFVRTSAHHSLAVLVCNEYSSTIADDGEINIHADITFRP